MNNRKTHNLSAGISDNLAAALEEEIVTLGLAPEARLTEEDIAEKYGVSRSPVRDALRTLEREGLVVRQARKGIWVAPMSLRDFDEVYTCRIALEALASEAAARSQVTGLKEELAEALEEMRAASETGDAHAFFTADVRGSELIYELADNQTLRRLLQGLEKQALRYRFFLYKVAPDLVRLSFDESAEIISAICENRPTDAKEMSSALIEKIWQAAREIVEDEFGKGTA
ncbi:GntR family transcriptional regulator [Celeribacter litoreus]|uniref:GntR family transcriptional regulator n=1 Tax=Celeribacter litoreus TaxID=2876714 RepID=UPI001CCF639E|nr:GntR family transcriptional regulator [Celeribacter litoreus]MCA0045064.1 GntR family transcriptional regulator [Celeribacter litoreus]